MKVITVYTKPSCVQCTATKRWLDKRGIEYTTVDLAESLDDFRAVKALGYAQAPVTIISDGNPEQDVHWGGFDVYSLERYCLDGAA